MTAEKNFHSFFGQSVFSRKTTLTSPLRQVWQICLGTVWVLGSNLVSDWWLTCNFPYFTVIARIHQPEWYCREYTAHHVIILSRLYERTILRMIIKLPFPPGLGVEWVGDSDTWFGGLVCHWSCSRQKRQIWDMNIHVTYCTKQDKKHSLYSSTFPYIYIGVYLPKC